jgi:hypothetical protein
MSFVTIVTNDIFNCLGQVTKWGFFTSDTNQEGHMQLMTNELLNPYCFTHSIARDV